MVDDMDRGSAAWQREQDRAIIGAVVMIVLFNAGWVVVAASIVLGWWS